MTHPGLRLLSMTLLVGCGGGEAVPEDALLAAEAAGHFTAGLETAAIVGGLITEFSTEDPADEAVEAAAAVLDELLGSCASIEATAGESTALLLDFGTDGCAFLETPLVLYGAVSYQTTETGVVETWTIAFDALQIGDVTLDGAITMTQVLGLTAGFELADLTVSYGDVSLNLTSTGGLQTSASHLEVGFSASGSFTWADRSWSLDAVDVSRALLTDCYPEAGVVEVRFADDAGAERLAVVTFEDRQLGLDSDDSGKVAVTLDGEEHVVTLPSRGCIGL